MSLVCVSVLAVALTPLGCVGAVYFVGLDGSLVVLADHARLVPQRRHGAQQ